MAHAEFGVGQSGTSKHLRELRVSTLVVSRIDGARRIYRLQPQQFDELARWAQRQTRFWNDKLDALEQELGEGHQR